MATQTAPEPSDPPRNPDDPGAPTRILIVDDHTTFAELLAGALDREDDLHCVGFAKNATSGVAQSVALRPDIVIMDYHLPDEDGISAASRILQQEPETRVVMLTGDPTMDALEKAATLGVCAFMPKDGSLATMLHTIRNSRVGGFIVHPSLVAQLATQRRTTASPPTTVTLTKREHEILELMTKGNDVRVNARILGISEHTCRGHVKSILAKLGAHSQLEAVVLATKLGLVRDNDGDRS